MCIQIIKLKKNDKIQKRKHLNIYIYINILKITKRVETTTAKRKTNKETKTKQEYPGPAT